MMERMNDPAGQGVHDEVEPQHLDRGERRLSHEKSADARGRHRGDVHRELKLQKFLNALVHVTAPSHGGHSRAEVIVQQENVAGVLGDGGTGEEGGAG